MYARTRGEAIQCWRTAQFREVGAAVEHAAMMRTLQETCNDSERLFPAPTQAAAMASRAAAQLRATARPC